VGKICITAIIIIIISEVITIARHREMTVKHTYDAPFATLLTPDPWTETKRRSEMFTHWPRNGSLNINGPGPLTRVIYIEKFIICRHLSTIHLHLSCSPFSKCKTIPESEKGKGGDLVIMAPWRERKCYPSRVAALSLIKQLRTERSAYLMNSVSDFTTLGRI